MNTVSAVLLDIEGTITPVAFVFDVLFPYARARFDAFLAEHWDEPAVTSARLQIAADASAGEFARAELVAHLQGLMDRDAKTTGLKMLQGLIWRGGYEAGELQSQIFADVVPVIRDWHRRGLKVAIYSSGSVAAQKLLLRHSNAGDLTQWVDAYFDTRTGPKRDAESYAAIAAALERPSGEILFCSDVPAELDAAAAAQMPALLVVRPGNAAVEASAHRRITSLDQAAVHHAFPS